VPRRKYEQIPFMGVDEELNTRVVWTHTTGEEPQMNQIPTNQAEDFAIGYAQDTLNNGGALLITNGRDGNITGMNGIYGNNPVDRAWFNRIIEQRGK